MGEAFADQCAKKPESHEVHEIDWDRDVVAFAVGELGLRLEEFFDMPWCEFLIKSYAYNRMQEERLRHTRLIAWTALTGSHLDPKGLPKSIDSFLPIGKKKSRVSEEMKALFRQRMIEYNEATKK